MRDFVPRLLCHYSYRRPRNHSRVEGTLNMRDGRVPDEGSVLQAPQHRHHELTGYMTRPPWDHPWGASLLASNKSERWLRTIVLGVRASRFESQVSPHQARPTRFWTLEGCPGRLKVQTRCSIGSQRTSRNWCNVGMAFIHAVRLFGRRLRPGVLVATQARR